MTKTQNATAAAGRLLMSIIFILAGLQKLGTAGDTVAYMASHGLPAPALAAAVAIVVECVGGALLLAGYQIRRVGLVLAIWCVVTGAIGHSHLADPNQMAHFLKNLAMAGGFLLLVAFGAGDWSIDARAVRASGRAAADRRTTAEF
jgi:putative oxidoreductase